MPRVGVGVISPIVPAPCGEEPPPSRRHVCSQANVRRVHVLPGGRAAGRPQGEGRGCAHPAFAGRGGGGVKAS
ncbi:Protein of unknown function [Gryllus bimaculatus]|nr:Protein of unknown function [Gryllus bimaculatus]